MTTPSTADSKEAGVRDHPIVEKGATGSSATHAAVKGETAPRLPHERDESSDSGTAEPSEVMKKAADDVRSGHSDDPRGPQAQQHYSDLTEKAAEQAKPG